jgi:HAD superfamily hydrolase (TIGR01509 family)
LYCDAARWRNADLCYDPQLVPSTQTTFVGLALLFDLDGVIVDSNPVHVQVWRDYLSRYSVDPGDSLPARMYGRRNDEIVRDLFGSHLTDGEVFWHGAAKEALYREAMGGQLASRLVPGVVAFIESQRGRAMAVATNAEPANAEFVLTETGLRNHFAAVVDGHQVERPKPAPDIYLRAAQLLGRPPRNCIVFEDSSAGVEAARAAGARVVALTTTETRFPAADLCIEDFLSRELRPWLDRQTERP